MLVNQMLLTQFIEYIQLYKNFETSYDQILQPQKRLVIRRLLEATMGRMIELKHELVKHQLNYIQFHEPVLKVKLYIQWFAKDWYIFKYTQNVSIFGEPRYVSFNL